MTNRFAGITHALLRIVSGLLFIFPGGVKLFGWFGLMPTGMKLTPLLWAAGTIELVGGALIAVGLFTRPVAFLASGEMAYAYFSSHAPKSFFPVVNQGGPAILFCFIFLFLAASGAGPCSLDSLLASRRRSIPPA